MTATVTADSLLRRELRGRPLLLARGAAGAIFAIALALFVRGIPGTIGRASERAEQLSSAAPWIEATTVLVTWIGITAGTAWCALAALILWRRSRDLFGISLVLGFVAIGTVLASPEQIIIDGGSAFTRHADPWREFGRTVVWLLTALSLFWIFAFPDGRPVPRWGLIVVIPWFFWGLLRIPFPDELAHTRYGAAGALLYSAFPIAALASQVYRFARTADVVQREQLKWFIYGAALIIAAWVTAVVIPSVVAPADGPSASDLLYRAASRGWLAVATMIMPVTIAIALFRLGFLNIDFLINRTVMYSVLTTILVVAFIIAGAMAQRAYALIVGDPSEAVVLAVALPIALAFAPLRARMQSIADHFLSERVVLTVVFLDLAGSTAKAAELGDRAWRDLLERYRSVVRRELRRHGGHEIDTAGDGFFVTFGSPGAAIRFAYRAVAAVQQLGMSARGGLHVGECEMHGRHVSGISVHIGARIVAAASAGEVLVSRTLRDLVSGSDIRLTDRGFHTLKGVAGRWHLYSVAPG